MMNYNANKMQQERQAHETNDNIRTVWQKCLAERQMRFMKNVKRNENAWNISQIEKC